MLAFVSPEPVVASTENTRHAQLRADNDPGRVLKMGLLLVC